MKIQPKTSAAKDKTGNLYVAVSFDVLASDSVTGPVQNATIVFRDAAGKVLPNGAIPLVAPITPLSESQDLSAAISSGVALAGETRAAMATRLGAPVVVLTRGVVLAC